MKLSTIIALLFTATASSQPVPEQKCAPGSRWMKEAPYGGCEVIARQVSGTIGAQGSSTFQFNVAQSGSAPVKLADMGAPALQAVCLSKDIVLKLGATTLVEVKWQVTMRGISLTAPLLQGFGYSGINTTTPSEMQNAHNPLIVFSLLYMQQDADRYVVGQTYSLVIQ
jgi:hypothetical protein